MKKNGNKHTHVVVSKRPDVSFDRTSHVRGVHQGNLAGHANVQRRTDQEEVEARRSTGIAAEDRAPIDPKMPNLPPA
jgi:hypothetical protein